MHDSLNAIKNPSAKPCMPFYVDETWTLLNIKAKLLRPMALFQNGLESIHYY
jgi:hypothetical protein